jgi:putative endonuclease
LPTKTPTDLDSTRVLGQRAEDLALAYLRQAGLQLVQRNYRTPGRGGGEIDLILRALDGTLVFVEVRMRRTVKFGGAAASVTWHKQKRLVFAARFYLMRWARPPPCRFDVVEVGPGPRLNWLQGAFEVG